MMYMYMTDITMMYTYMTGHNNDVHVHPDMLEVVNVFNSLISKIGKCLQKWT